MFFPFINQENNNDCGLACFAMIYKFYFKKELELNNLKQECQLLVDEGIDLLQLKNLAKKYFLKFDVFQIDLKQLNNLVINNPMIIQIINENFEFHFVVIYKRKRDFFLIADPKENCLIWYKINNFNNNFTGIIINCEKENNVIILKTKFYKFNPFSVNYYIVYSLNFLFTNLFLVIISFIIQIFYKAFINQIIINSNFNIALLLLISYFILNAIHLLINFILNKLSKIFYYYFIKHLIEKFYQTWFSMQPTMINNFNNGYYLQIYQDISSITNVFTNNILELIINFITMITVSVILIKISVLVWISSFIVATINLFFNFIVMKIQSPMIKKNINQKLLLQNSIIAVNENFEDCYFRNLLAYLKNNINKKTNQAVLNDFNLDRNKNNNVMGNNFIKIFLNFIIMYLLLNLICSHQISFAMMIFISSINIYLLNFFYHLGNFCYFYPSFQKSYHRFNNFISITTKKPKHNSYITSVIREIKIINCTFNIKNKIIFRNFNLSVSGHNLLIGNNGSGKSTLLSLLNLKYQNYHGIINIDHINLKEYDINLWQKQCVYVSVNSNVMYGTILENLFSFNITKEKFQILKELEIEKLLLKFNLKLNDYCQNNSKNLSQGQKQIIVFLSLFFNNWKVILLDEILSNINYEFKNYLIKMLLNNFPQAIIIYASHDLILKKFINNIIDLNNTLIK